MSAAQGIIKVLTSPFIFSYIQSRNRSTVKLPRDACRQSEKLRAQRCGRRRGQTGGGDDELAVDQTVWRLSCGHLAGSSSKIQQPDTCQAPEARRHRGAGGETATSSASSNGTWYLSGRVASSGLQGHLDPSPLIALKWLPQPLLETACGLRRSNYMQGSRGLWLALEPRIGSKCPCCSAAYLTKA